jgi:hypothetical protein
MVSTGPQDSLVVLNDFYEVYLLVPELFAIALTAFRLLYRRRVRALWWDDYFALLSMILMISLSSSVVLTIAKCGPHFIHYLFALDIWHSQLVFSVALCGLVVGMCEHFSALVRNYACVVPHVPDIQC